MHEIKRRQKESLYKIVNNPFGEGESSGTISRRLQQCWLWNTTTLRSSVNIPREKKLAVWSVYKVGNVIKDKLLGRNWDWCGFLLSKDFTEIEAQVDFFVCNFRNSSRLKWLSFTSDGIYKYNFIHFPEAKIISPSFLD